jgi:hypothetical protein
MAGVAGGSGAGGDAGAIRAGKAFVALGVKDETSAGLNAVKGKLAKVGTEFGKALGEGGGRAVEGVGRAGLIGGIAVIFREILTNATSLFPALSQSRREMEALESAAKSAASATARLNADFENARGLAGTPRESMALLNRQIAAQERAVKDRDRLLADAAERAAADPSLGRRVIGSGLIGSLTGIDAKQEVLDAMAARDRLGVLRAEEQKKLEELREARARVADPFRDPAFLNTFKNFGQAIADALDPAIESMGELERRAVEMIRANAGAGEAAMRRLEAIRAEAREADAAVRLEALNKTRDALEKDMTRADPDFFKKLPEWQARVREFISANPELSEFSRNALEADAKKLDAKLAAMEVRQNFGRELLNANLESITQGLSPEDAALARMVERGFSNDQIMQLRKVQKDMARRAGAGADTFSRGGMASAGLANSLGIADQWREAKKELELTNKHLDALRIQVEEMQKKFGFK